MSHRLFSNRADWTSPVRAPHAAKVSHGLAYDLFHEMTVPLHLAQEHRPLNHREAEVGELLLVRLRIETTARLLPDEERGDLCFRDLEDQTQILADQFIVFRHFVSDGTERAPARHPIALL